MLTELATATQQGLLVPGKDIGNLAWQGAPISPVSDGSPLEPLEQGLTVLIERRKLIRDCILHRLRKAGCNEVMAFSSLAEWAGAGLQSGRTCIVLYSVADENLAESEPDLMQLLKRPEPPAVVLLMTGGEGGADLADIVKSGIRGYIPTSMSVEVAVSVLHLVRAGGTFIPATCLELRTGTTGPDTRPGSILSQFNFTVRQSLVIDSLCQGKSNKIIAYELDMRECTVKIHVRNIMRKLKARNRTEVAMLITRPGSRLGANVPTLGRSAS